jgi:hypothetical protein
VTVLSAGRRRARDSRTLPPPLSHSRRRFAPDHRILRAHRSATPRHESPFRQTASATSTAVRGTYVRLLGERDAIDALTPKLDHIVIDRGDQVAADAEAIKLLVKRVPVVAFVNNHFAGFAPETLRQLAGLLA